jgi:hypothetical protein
MLFGSTKGWAKKNLTNQICFPYILSPGARIFKILVSIPHNFEDPSTWAQDIRITKFGLLGFS